MVVLDTDFMIGLLRENKSASEFMEKLERDGHSICTTTINAFELFEGALLSSKSKDKDTSEVEGFLKSIGSLNFNEPASWKAAEISSDLMKKGEPLDFQDIAIASIAMVNGEPIVTRNVKHFSRIKGLKIEKW